MLVAFIILHNSYKCCDKNSYFENYLLKPVNKEELLGTIKDMLEDIKSKRISDIQNRAGLTYLRNNTLNRIVKNEIKPNELRDKSELLELNIWTSSMQVAIFQPYLPNGKECESHEEGQDLLSAIFSICEESVKPNLLSDLKKGKEKWNNPVMSDSLKRFQELIRKGYWYKGSASFSYTQEVDELNTA